MRQDNFELGKFPSNQLDEINIRIYRDMLLAKVRRRVKEAEGKGLSLNKDEIEAITREEWEKMTEWKWLPRPMYQTGIHHPSSFPGKRSATPFSWPGISREFGVKDK